MVKTIQCVIAVLALCLVVRVAQAGQCRIMKCPDDAPSCNLPSEDYACGSDVVEVVITRLKTCEIFHREQHLQFLRRLAFVETRDGEDEIIKKNGGIWGLHEDKLNVFHSPDSLFENDTIWTVVSKCIAAVIPEIDPEKIEVPDVTTLSRPVDSGLVAALYLYYLKINGTASIPSAGNIAGQAEFWQTYYHSGTLTNKDFIQRVYILEREGT